MKIYIATITTFILTSILVGGGILFFKQDQLNYSRDIIEILQAQLDACENKPTN